MHPNDEIVVGNLADAYFWSGQKKKAMETYARAISLGSKQLEVNPRNSYVLGDLARYCAKTGDNSLADYYITRARSIDKSNPELIYSEVIVRLAAKQPKLAMEKLRLAFQKGYSPQQAELDPELSTLQSNPEFQELVNEFLDKR
jgi:tetratricopeptide (TPR) repeat protein